MARRPVLYLLAGLPGSGKSTYARNLAESGVIRVSVDDALIATHGRLGIDYPHSDHERLLAPVVEAALHNVSGLLQQGSDVVLDHGLGLRSERDRLKQIAQSLGATWELVRFDADLDALRARCAFRDLQTDAVPISDDALAALMSMWEPPQGEGEQRIDTNCAPRDFYSTTDRWWGEATSAVDAVDHLRAELTATQTAGHRSVLELGCGSGSTAVATAALGFKVTGIDFSNRIHRAETGLGGTNPAGSTTVHFLKADFLTYEFSRRFDIVTYWDGFGLGTRDDHIALLNRIADDLLTSDGFAIIEVYDPTGWSADHGLAERRLARPDAGYHFSLDQRRLFDHTTHQAVDAWLEDASELVWHQTLQCYSPTAFAELASDSRLHVDRVLDDLRSDWSYLALLRPVT